MIEKKQETFSRLSPFVLPTHYVLSIKPDLRNFKFTGSVKIDLDVITQFEEFIQIDCIYFVSGHRRS